jgi:hypothetical protein
MRRAIVIALGLTTACNPAAPEERAAEAQRDVAMVQKANDTLPPLEEVVPEPLGYPEIERYDLTGRACNFAPGTSFGALVIAREADAFMKIDGKVERFAADPGAQELPQRARSLYNSKEYSLRLRIKDQPSDAAQPGDLEGTVTLFDPQGRIVYEGTGLARCNA